MRKHVIKLLNHQRDLLQPRAIETVRASADELDKAIHENADSATLQKKMEELGAAAEKWLKPYPNAVWRENIEVLLVALTVAMGIRTFFLQPFKIPTGSMQPTLFGVTSDNLIRKPDFKVPTGWARVREWFEGVSYLHVVAKADGEMTSVEAPLRFLIFNIKQTLYIGGRAHTIWFPPDYGAGDAGTLEIVTNVKAVIGIPESDHGDGMTAEGTEVTPIAIPKAGKFRRTSVNILQQRERVSHGCGV